MGWVGGGGSGSPCEALGWRSGPPEQDKSLLHEGKNWAERLMEARNFEGKKSFLETRNREEAYQPQLLFKELFPAPPHIPPKNPTTEKPLLPHRGAQFPPAQLMAASSFHLLTPKTFPSNPVSVRLPVCGLNPQSRSRIFLHLSTTALGQNTSALAWFTTGWEGVSSLLL